jgi:hypothetical protein
MQNDPQTTDPLTEHAPRPETEATRRNARGRTLRALQWTFVGFGIGCLTGAAAIGAYTVFGASRPADCRAAACATTAHLATRLGWLVLLVAAGILACLLGYLRLPGHARVDYRLRIAIALVGTGVVIGYYTGQFTDSRDEVETSFRTWEQMWTVTAAVWLLAIGTGALALFTSHELRRPARFGAAGLVVGLVAALLLSAAQFHQALSKGDDSRYVDANVASEVGVEPKPAILGQKRFERPFPYERAVKIVPAGAGFVVKKSLFDPSDTPDVVAYDASGHERWHYQRTGPRPSDSPSSMSVSRLGVYADGGVVVLSLLGEHGLYVGLDAVTGAQLWTSTDPTIGAALDVSQFNDTTTRFVARDGGRWIAFDPHTGQRTWSIVDPAHCPGATAPDGLLPTLHGQHVYPVDTATRIGDVVDCSTRDRVDLRLVAVDPSSGAVTNDKTLSALDGIPREDIQSWTAVAVPGTDAVILKLFSTRRPLDAYVDATGLRTDFVGSNPLEPIGDGMFSMRDKETLRIYSGEALVQCDIPLGRSGPVDYAFLRDQVVVLDDRPPQLRVFDRAGCQQVGTIAVGPGFEAITPARGVTLLTHQTSRGIMRTSVMGFAT